MSGSIAPADVGRRYATESSGLLGEADQVIVGLPPVVGSEAAALSRPAGLRYLVHVVLLVLTVALGAEVLGTVAVRFVRPEQLDVNGPEEALLLSKSVAASRPYVLLLGDSVMREGALHRATGRSARESTIPHFLRARLGRDVPSAGVVDLSMEGALVNDYAGLLQLVIDHGVAPAAVLVQLDYRVLSPTQDDEQNQSRSWLAPYVRSVEPAARAEGASPELLARPIDEAMHRMLLRSDAFVLLRGGRQRLGAWADDRIEAALRRIGPLHAPAAAVEDTEAVKLTVGQFYRTDRTAAGSRMLADLLRALDGLAARKIPVLVGFTPTNVDYLGDQVNVPAYRANVATVRDAVEAHFHGAALVRWVSLDGDVPAGFFVDHVHMTADGNRLVADRLADNLLVLLRDTTT